MARIRSVHPDIAEDETLVNVSPSAERTFVRLWTYLDDEGRGKDNTRLIKAAIYPLHDHMGPAEVDADLWELVEHGLLMRYEADGVPVISAKPSAWGHYQKPQRPKESKLPAPPEDYTPPTPPPSNDDTPSRHASATRTRHVSDASQTDHGRVHAGEGVGEGDGRQEMETRAAPSRSTALAVVPRNGSAPSARVQTLPTAMPPTGQYPSDFEAWYAVYPRKRGKADAARAWKKARASATWEQIMGGLERAVEAWGRENTPPDKIPYPASWLNGRRWEDEPDIPLAATVQPKARTALERAAQRRGLA